MSSDFNLTVTSWFLANVRIKPYFKWPSNSPPIFQTFRQVWACVRGCNNKKKRKNVLYSVHILSFIRIKKITIYIENSNFCVICGTDLIYALKLIAQVDR